MGSGPLPLARQSTLLDAPVQVNAWKEVSAEPVGLPSPIRISYVCPICGGPDDSRKPAFGVCRKLIRELGAR